ncbi:MAG: phosphotransferase [Nanobdellota archaeon]
MQSESINNNEIERFLNSKYGIKSNKIKFLSSAEDGDYYKVSSKDNAYFLKIYLTGKIFSKSKKELSSINEFLYNLREKYGFNHAHAPVRNKDKKTISSFKGRPFILLEFIPGENPKELTIKDYEKLGKIISKLHNLPKAHFKNIKSDRFNFSLEKKIFNILNILEKSNFKQRTSASRLKDLFVGNKKFIAELFTFLKKESLYIKGKKKDYVICHGDLHKGNILKSNKGIFIIDWEHLKLALPEQDLMWFREKDGIKKQFYGPYLDGLNKKYVFDKRAMKFYTLKKGMEEFVFFSTSILSGKRDETDSNKKIDFMDRQFKILYWVFCNIIS